jgi:hypothetical protein
MVQCFIPGFGGGDGYLEVVFNPRLPDKIIKAAGTEAGIK